MANKSKTTNKPQKTKPEKPVLVKEPKKIQTEKLKKAELHQVNVICNCGNKFKTLSTSKEDLKVEICSACHPLYTGTQKLIDTTGQVEKYKERLAKVAALKKQRSKKK